MAIPGGDYYNFAGFKLTRNNQAADKVVIQIWSATNSRLFGTVETNSMGGAYGTSNAYLGTRVDAGSELRAINYDNSTPISSNGTVGYSQNQWQSNSGAYNYQTADGTIYVDPPQQAYWYNNVPPSISPTGGLLYTSCGC